MWRFPDVPWLSAHRLAVVLATLLSAGPARAAGDAATLAPPGSAGPGVWITWPLIVSNAVVVLLGLSWVLLMRRQLRR